MPGKFPTALHMAETLQTLMRQRNGVMAWPGMNIAPMTRDEFHGLEARRFDITLSDGRIYRVRVSDISPPPAERRKEPA